METGKIFSPLVACSNSAPVDDFLTLGAAQLALLIRQREVSPVEVVHAHIDHASRINAKVNAIVLERFQEGIREAQEAEKKICRREPVGALFGIPCTVKEGLGLQGWPHTSGSRLRQGQRAESDATVVARIRNAGAIVIGLTNQSEMALWPESKNLVYGRTENPWRNGHTAGGSSGGEAAIVASGGSVFGLGTDGGGSIRIPAAYCGVFGHKPSSRIVPLSGHVPLDAKFVSTPGAQEQARYFAPGPIARSAEDLMLILRAISGPDGIDTNIEPCKLQESSISLLKGRRVLVCDAPSLRGGRVVTPAVSSAVLKAACALEALGAIVIPWNDKLLAGAFDIWASTIAAAEGPSMQEMVGLDRPLALMREMFYRLAGRPNHTLAAALTCLSEKWMSPNQTQLSAKKLLGSMLRMHLETALEGDAILLLPPVPRAAPRHGHAFLRPFDIGLSALFNALEMPATVAPIGRDDNGFPLSVQIVGLHGRDHLTIAAALGIEQVLGGWRISPV
ncbi:amidase [Vreelandella stevensii]|uniref:amidase n=1 Tax=Vreelandella stevensii TaxID=502821 RepID=UPI0002EBEEC2|nr:amidase [Halomonas stevensii]